MGSSRELSVASASAVEDSKALVSTVRKRVVKAVVKNTPSKKKPN